MQQINQKYKRIITFGTFDLFHEGHYNILKRAKKLGDYLIVGVSSDELNIKKGKKSEWSLDKRLKHVADCEFVDEVFVEESLEKKKEYVNDKKADILVMGDDWLGCFDWVGIRCIYFPRTINISTTLKKLTEATHKKKYTFLFYDTADPKHKEYSKIVTHYFDKYNIKYYDYKDDIYKKNVENEDEIINSINAIIQFNSKKIIEDEKFHEKIKNKPKILIDHGSSNSKWFLLETKRFDSLDYFLVAGPDHKKSMEYFTGKNDRIISTGFIKSEFLFEKPKLSKTDFCKNYQLNENEKIILYAPTWFLQTSNLINEHFKILEQLEKYGNYVISFHPANKKLLISDKYNKRIINNHDSSNIMKLCDIIVSDNSSIMAESLIIGKKTIQVLMSSYSDNPSKNYRYPLTAGTCKYYLIGIPTLPQNLYDTILSLDQIPNNIYNTIYFNVQKNTYFASDAYEKILKNLISICDKPLLTSQEILKPVKTDILHNQRHILINIYSNIIEEINKNTKLGYRYFKINSLNEKESINKLVSLINDNIGIRFIFNINDFTQNYEILNNIKKNIILEIYSLKDYQYVENNYENIECIFSTLNYNNCYSQEIFGILNYINYGKNNLIGIVIHYKNFNDINLIALQSYGKIVYIETRWATTLNIKNIEILKKSCGIYLNNVVDYYDLDFDSEYQNDFINNILKNLNINYKIKNYKTNKIKLITIEEIFASVYLIYLRLLKRLPDENCLKYLNKTVNFHDDPNYLISQIVKSQEYKNIKHNLQEKIYVINIENIDDLIVMIEEFYYRNILPTEVIVYENYIFIINYKYDTCSIIDIYKIIRTKYLLWKIYKILYTNTRPLKSKLEYFYKLILGRNIDDGALKYYTEKYAHTHGLLCSNEYLNRFNKEIINDIWDNNNICVTTNSIKICPN